MKIAIYYDSVTGNTEQLAEALRFHLRGENAFLIQENVDALADCDVVFAGSWTDKGDCSEPAARFLEKLEGKNVFLFGTCGYGCSQDYFDTVLRRFSGHLQPGNRLIGSFLCQGRMPVTVVRRYEAMLEANPDSSRWEACIANYNQALSHPNADDLHMLCDAADQALALI